MDFGFVVLCRCFWFCFCCCCFVGVCLFVWVFGGGGDGLWFFLFNNCFSVVLPVTFSNTDFEIFFPHILCLLFSKWNECSIKCLVSPLQWNEVNQLNQRLIFHLSLSSSFTHLSNHYILSSILLSVFTCSSSSCSIPPAPEQGSREAVSSLSLFKLAVRQSSLGCWLSMPELCTSI